MLLLNCIIFISASYQPYVTLFSIHQPLKTPYWPITSSIRMWNKFVPGRETNKVSRAPGRLCSLWAAVKPESLNWAELLPDRAAPCTAVCPNPDEDRTTAVWENPSAAPQHSYQTLAAATVLVANPHFHTDLKKESVHMVNATKLLQNLRCECHYVTFSFCLFGCFSES